MVSSTRGVAQRAAYLVVPLTIASLTLVVGAGSAVAATSAPAANVGLPPTAVAVDAAAHTAYVAVTDGNSDQVAVVDTSTCSSTVTSCTGSDVATVQLAEQSAPAAIAFDSANSTVYVAESDSGDLDMINAATCNATVTAGCASSPATASTTFVTPDGLAVDTSGGSNALYVADAGTGTVVVVGGATCSATVTTGCGTTQTVTVGDAPGAIAVDPATATVYVADLADDTLSAINETDCSALAAACATDTVNTQTLDEGAAPLGLALSLSSPTLYVAESGTAEIGLVATATCNAAMTTTCSTAATTVPLGTEPDAVAVEAGGFLAVGDGAATGVTVFNDSTCKVGTTTGCATQATQTTNGSVDALAATSATVYAADAGNDSLDVVSPASLPRIKATLKSAHAKTKFGWYRSNVTVTFSCTAGTNPLTAACPSPVTVTKSAKNQKVTKTISATDGGSASVTVSINLDKVKPKVAVKGVKSGHTYAKSPHLRCVASDGLSGVASCKIAKKKHRKTVDYTATATDKAGNVATVHGHYKLKG